MKELGGEELWAQACIQQALPGCRVAQHDDGSLPGMYDLKITYPDGSIGAAEVTAAADAEQVELWKLVGGRGERWIEPSLVGGWMVRILPSTRARVLHKRLPGLLWELEHEGVSVIGARRTSADRFAASAGKLGVVEARQGATAHAGSIYEGYSGRGARVRDKSPVSGAPT